MLDRRSARSDRGRSPGDELLEHGDGFIELDQDWVIVRVNAAQERTTGKFRSETLGRVFWEVWPEVADPQGDQWREYHRCMQERVAVEFESHYRPFDTWFAITAYPTSTGGIAVFFRDVTVQKKGELAVRAEHAFTAAVLDTVANIVVVLDRDGTIVRVNKACERVTGYSGSEVIGRPVFDVFIRDDELPGVRQTFSELRAGHFPNHYENRWRMKDGSERVLEWDNTALMDDDGAVAFVIATGIDVTERRRDEERLRRSEAALRRYAELVEHALVLVRNMEDEIEVWNEGAERLYGWTRDEAIGRVSHDLLQTEFPEPLQDIEDTLRREGRWEGELLHRHRDGSERIVTSTWVLHPDANGDDPVAVIEVNADITALKRAEAAVRDGERRLRAMFDDAAVGIVEVDEADRIVAVNARFCGMLGYARDELLGRTIHDITAPEDRDITRAMNARGHSGEVRVFDYEKRYLRKDGAPVWVHVNVSIVRDDGRFVRAIGTAEDITERKRAESDLRDANLRLRSHVEATPLGVVEWDSDYRVVGYSRRAQEMFGWSADDVLGKRIDEIPWVPEEDWPSVRAVMHDMDAGMRPTNVNANRNTRKDGSFIECEWYNSTLYDEAGRMRSVLSLVLDVTDRKRAEGALRAANEQLREADRRKDEFLGMLSHELRNPLAPIRNSLFILDRVGASGPQADRARQVASRQIGHLTRLVDDLLDMTRIARGKIDLKRADVDLAALARRIADDYRAVIHDRGLMLDVEAPEDPVIVNGDETRLAQVLGNLLSNAAKFTPGGGRVLVAVEAGSQRAAVCVHDTGPGIDPEVLPSIFEPFTQAKQTLARSEGGLGLGLALVKALVALHGGEVTVTSEGGGQGTKFLVTLPLASPSAARAREDEPRAAGHIGKRRVLVIDDNRDAAESLAEVVAMLGHEADVAYDAYAALRKAMDDLPDVVLCDIGLPGMDGYEFARQLRARAGNHPVRLVAVSGYAQPEDVAKAAEAGFEAHVAKPVDPARIEQLLT